MLLYVIVLFICFFFSSRRRHTRSLRDWSSDVCSSDLLSLPPPARLGAAVVSTEDENFYANPAFDVAAGAGDRKSTRLNSSHVEISYAVFCLKKKKNEARSSSRRFSCGGRRHPEREPNH